MILSKGNLQVVQIAQDDKNIPGLDNVLIESDGRTIAVNRNTVIIVAPVEDKVRKAVPLAEMPLDKSIVISSETIKEVVKNIPRDTMFKGLLEHCDVDSEGVFTITDGKRKKRITGRKYEKEFVDYQRLLGKGEVVYSVALNYKRLYSLLGAINKIAPDVVGESIVFIEFTSDDKMVLRARNMKNKQEVFVITTTYKDIDYNSEKFLLPIKTIKTKRKRKFLKRK